MLTRGVAVEYSDEDGRFRGAQVQVIDFEDYSANDWLAVSQFTVEENRKNAPRRHCVVRQWSAVGCN